MASRIALAAIGLVSGAILARGLGPDGKGAYELVVLMSTLGVSWGGLGVDLAVMYFAGQGVFAERDLKRTLLWLGALWGAALGMIGFVGTRYIGERVVPGVDPDLLLLAAGLIPFLLTLQYQRAYLLGRDRLLAYNGINLAAAGATCLGVLLAVVGMRTGLHGAVWAYAVAHILTLGLVLRLNHVPIIRPSPAKVAAIAGQLLKFGGKAQVGNTLQYFSYRADLFIINWFLGTASVGYYSVALALAEIIWYLPRSVALVLLPYIAAGSHEDAERVTPMICRQTMLLSLLTACGLAVLGPLIIMVCFGEAFWPAVWPLWLLLPGVVVASWVKPLASYQLGRGRPLTSLYIALLSVPFSIGAYLLLIPPFGIAGAAVASSISYATLTALELYFLFRVSSIRLVELLVPRRSDWTLCGRSG
jgi:O-antigen/teichoic acid export membrane protein